MSEFRELPQSVVGPLALYRLAAPCLAGILLPGLILRLQRRGNWKRNFGQRFGWFHAPDLARLRAHRWTWIHSISVGETLVALKLARALHAADSRIRIALSVTTSTGYGLACEAASDWLFPMYNPVDALGPVSRVLKLLRPERLILIEGEVWPNLVSACFQRRIPLVLANARLSPRSAARFARSRRWTAPFFQMLDWVGVPDPEDVPRWEAVGVSPDRLRLTGSIKFDNGGVADRTGKDLLELLKPSGIGPQTPLLVAGSTHDGEEVLLVRALALWRKRHPDLRLVIVPRHVERVPALVPELEACGVRVVRRTALPASGSPDVILVDTTGELRGWYAIGTVAFVGKSLTAEGGQNPVEPALAGKAVVFGPNMQNFAVIVAHLLSVGAVLQVQDMDGLVEAVDRLLGDPAERELLGTKAVQALQQHQGAAERTAALILSRA
jgi:3-deoxy-D-manno-octulosonic-acid transferase